jgi:DNA-binding NtrC family response regulator
VFKFSDELLDIFGVSRDAFKADFDAYLDFILDGVLAKMQEYEWQGNARELKNSVERAIIHSNTEVLAFSEFSENKSTNLKRFDNLKLRTLDQVQKDHLIKVLKDCGWKISGNKGAAKTLGLKLITMRDKMTILGVLSP